MWVRTILVILVLVTLVIQIWRDRILLSRIPMESLIIGMYHLFLIIIIMYGMMDIQQMAQTH